MSNWSSIFPVLVALGAVGVGVYGHWQARAFRVLEAHHRYYSTYVTMPCQTVVEAFREESIKILREGEQALNAGMDYVDVTSGLITSVTQLHYNLANDLLSAALSVERPASNKRSSLKNELIEAFRDTMEQMEDHLLEHIDKASSVNDLDSLCKKIPRYCAIVHRHIKVADPIFLRLSPKNLHSLQSSNRR